MIELGCKVKDKITGFEGIVIGICYYMKSNSRVLVEKKEGDPVVITKTAWIDDDRLEEMNEKC